MSLEQDQSVHPFRIPLTPAFYKNNDKTYSLISTIVWLTYHKNIRRADFFSISGPIHLNAVPKRKIPSPRFPVSRTALGPTQLPIQWVPRGGVFPWRWNGRGVKLTTHLHLVSRSKNAWSYTSTPPIRLHGVLLSWKYRDNFTMEKLVHFQSAGLQYPAT
jgi:hypothetical protein